MDIEHFREHCLAKSGVTEEFPFDENTLVFKVMGKMFALTDVADFTSINLKVEPETGVELREQYPAVQPGYHMPACRSVGIPARRHEQEALDYRAYGWGYSRPPYQAVDR